MDKRRAPMHFSDLKEVKRSRLVAAALAFLLCLFCIVRLYAMTFPYANTAKGLQRAVEDYVPSPDDTGATQGISPDSPLRVTGSAVQGQFLYVAYAADNADHVHGILTMKRGINGKYRPMDASESPFPYTAGIWTGNLWTSGNVDNKYFFLVGDNCQEIASVRLVFRVWTKEIEEAKTAEKTFAITEPDFLWIFEGKSFAEELGLSTNETNGIFTDAVVLLDKNGNDVTDQYRDDNVNDSWGASKNTAESFLIYVYMGIVAVVGIVVVKYFLRKEENA